MSTEKTCTKCDKIKSLENFSRNSRYKSGYDAQCKDCRYLANKLWRVGNPEKTKATSQRLYLQNRAQNLQRAKEYGEAHREEKKQYDRIYRAENRTKIASSKNLWESRNKDNPLVKLKRNMRRRLNHVLNGTAKPESCFDLVGCSPIELKGYLENQFLPNMTWNNYCPFGWHVDHIKPCRTFDLSIPEQRQACFHFNNLRPLWWYDNLGRKRNDLG